MYVDGEVAEAKIAVLALPSRFCTYEPVTEHNMEVAATLMAPKAAWELEGLAIRMQERRARSVPLESGGRLKRSPGKRGRIFFFTHKEVLSMPRDI